MRAPIMNKFTVSQQKREVLQDEVIWSRKRYQSRPRLCRSDGEIMTYRRYCAQFYPDPSENGRSSAWLCRPGLAPIRTGSHSKVSYCGTLVSFDRVISVAHWRFARPSA